MRTSWSRGRTVAAMLLFAACTDATAPPGDDATNGGRLNREPTPEELEGMPPEFQAPASITSLVPAVAFEPGRAVGSAVMTYFANRASLDVTLSTMRDGAVLASVTASEVKTHLIPVIGSISTATALPVPSDCGLSATVNAVGEVRKELMVKLGSLFQWDTRKSTRRDIAYQPPCSSSCPTGGGGGSTPATSPLTGGAVALECTGPAGGGGEATSGGYWIAVTTTHCYGHHYYDSNGRYLHSVITHCETTTSYYFQVA